MDFIESTLDSDQRVSLMHHDLSDAAKGMQHNIMSAGRLRALVHLTNPERELEADYSLNLQLPKFQTSQMILLFCNFMMWLILHKNC